jgi:hypothetical protein
MQRDVTNYGFNLRISDVNVLQEIMKSETVSILSPMSFLEHAFLCHDS